MEVIVVEDRVDAQCVRHVHLISNEEFGRNTLRPYGVSNGIVTREAGAWNFRASHPFRGVVDMHGICREGKFRRLVMWSLEGCASVKVALHEAAREFERLFSGRAQFGFIRKLPKGAEHGMDIGDLTLFEAEWMLNRCVAVGGRVFSG